MAPSIDEFEDLTQFADESFDTEEVDLFEFSDNEDSPLLRLKSIVLSLDWDITEEILTELNEELASLRAMWKDDKVAQIYLQGMENVGKYMQAEEAYAHPNAIKLLLTLYHNYEKIISSSNLSSESITAMLKADIRKFKVLQYQISALKNAHGGSPREAAEAEPEELPVSRPAAAAPPPTSAAAQDKDSAMPGPLRSMEATILGLEWEVTDEGLEKFSKESAELRSHLSGNKEAQVLVQGLQVLGAYIREQKTNAHPDSFTILHSFYDALKMLLESPQLGAEQRRHILLEQIGSLNSLKEVIARSAGTGRREEEKSEPAPAAEPEAAEVEDEPASPAGADAEDDFGGNFSFDDEQEDAAGKPAAPAKPAAASGDDEDEFDDDLFSGGGIVPALADAEDEGGFSDSFASAGLGSEREAELDEKLDSFFNFEAELDEVKPTAKAAASEQPAASAKPSLAHLLDDDAAEDEDDDSSELDSSFFDFDDELDEAAGGDKGSALGFDDDSILDDDEVAAVPAAGNEAGQSLSSAAAAGLDEEDDELDSFFNFDNELDEPSPSEAQGGAAAPAAAVSEPEDVLSMDSGLFSAEEDDDGPVAALADEEEAPAAEAQDEEDTLDSGSLDSFFSFDDEDSGTAAPAAAAAEPEDVLSMDSGIFSAEDDDGPVAALADEEEAPAAEAQDEEDTLDSGSLDSFFSFDDEDSGTAAPAAAVSEPEDVLSMDSGIFSAENDDGPVAALADEEEAEAQDEEDTLDSGSLDSFFSFDDEDSGTAAPAAAVSEPEDVLSMDSGIFSAEDDDGPVAALADEEEAVPAAEAQDEEDTLDSGSLDSFFSFDDEDSGTAAPAAAAAEPEDVLSMDSGPAAALVELPEIGSEKAAEIKSKLDSLFSFEDDPLTNDAQNDMPDLDDDLITPLDDELSAPIETENFFSAEEFSDNSGHAESAAEEDEQESAEAADSLSEEQDDDAFFGFDSGMTSEADAADSQPASDFAEESQDAVPAAEDTDEAFFSFTENADDDSFSGEAAEAEPAAEDEPFGLAAEEEAAEADSLSEEQDDDAFFGFDSGMTSEADAADSQPASDFAEEREDLAPAAEDADESFFSFTENADDGSFSGEAAEAEPAAEDEPFGLAAEEEAAEADSLSEEQGDDAFFGFDSGMTSEADAADSQPASDFAEENGDLAPAADVSLSVDTEDDDLLLGKEYETDSQSAFFGQDDLPDPFASSAAESESAEEEAADDAVVSVLNEHGAGEAAAFASLSAAAAALPAAPSSSQLRQVAELASAARREAPLSAPQAILLNLLDSSAALLAQAPGETAGGGVVMQELAAALELADEPAVLAGAVSRYTAWQQDLFAELLRRPQAPEKAAAEGLGLVREEFSRFRQELLTEFSQLRKEIMTLRS